MKVDKTNTANINILERKRIEEIKSLSYFERLERLMILIEVSYTLNLINRISIQNRIKLQVLNLHF